MRVCLLALLLLQILPGSAAGGALERAMLGKSTVVDLTHPLTETASTPIGPDVPEVQRPDSEASEPSGKSLPTLADRGTHLDAGAVGENNRASVARIPARDLLVHAVVVDIASQVAQAADYRATVEDLQDWERRNGRIPKGSVVLLHTGWARRWGDPARYLNLDAQGVPRVPGFSVAAVAFLVRQRDVRGVGLDAFTPEPPGGAADDGKHRLLQGGRWQLENLTNLHRLPPKGAKLVIAPLRLEAGSAPARVIAILP